MKKIYKFVLIFIIVVLSINCSSPALAKCKDSATKEERLKELCYEVKNMKIEDAVSELKEQGLSLEDAEYYVRLNNLVRLMETENLEIEVTEGVEDISDHDFLMNKKYYREKILEGDKKALKKAMKSLDRLINGGEYAERVISTFSHKAAVEIIYPDGAKITYDTRSKESEVRAERERGVQKENQCDPHKGMSHWSGNKQNGVYKSARLDYEETRMDEGLTYAYDNIGWREGQWAFESGLSFSKVYLYTEFILGEEGVSTVKYARGGQSSYGIVNIANSTGGVISRQNSNGDGFPAEARNEVVFTVSGSFGASFLILSLAVEPGMNWTQYIIFRLYDTEKVDDEYRAKYQWYAAEYK